MGEVWLAIDSRLGRKVALKLLPTAETSDNTRVRRFEQEARAASTLSHPDVRTIHAAACLPRDGSTRWESTPSVALARARLECPRGSVRPLVARRTPTTVQGAPYFNLWGVRCDPDRGSPIGGPFALTRFDTPALRISPDVGWTEIGISATRAVLTMETVRGNIWMMENVDR